MTSTEVLINDSFYNVSSNVTNLTFPYWNADAESIYPVPGGLIALLSFFYGTISVVAVVGNSLVIWIVATSRRMQNVTNCYIANLALADIVIGLFAIPFQFQAAVLQRWNLPNFMCAFCPFVQALSVSVSVFTLTAIAVDRHRAILYPLSAWQSKRAAKIVIGCIWLMALALATPMALALQVEMVEETDTDTQMEYQKPFCVPSKFSDRDMTIYRMILFFLQYITPLCIISWAYAKMALELWGSQAPGNAQDSRDASLMKNKKKVIKMLVIVVVLFALCWLPLQTYQVLQMCVPSINEYRYINIIFFCFDWLAMSNSCYNPFIYGIYNEKFKREFRQRFRFCRKSKNNVANNRSIDLDRNNTIVARYSSFRSTCETRLNSTRRTSIIPRTADRSGADRKEYRNNNNGTTVLYPHSEELNSCNTKVHRNSLPESGIPHSIENRKSCVEFHETENKNRLNFQSLLLKNGSPNSEEDPVVVRISGGEEILGLNDIKYRKSPSLLANIEELSV